MIAHQDDGLRAIVGAAGVERIGVRIAEAAALVGISESEMRRLVGRHEIASVYVGKVRIVDLASLRRWWDTLPDRRVALSTTPG